MIIDYLKHLFLKFENWLAGLTFFGFLPTDDSSFPDSEKCYYKSVPSIDMSETELVTDDVDNPYLPVPRDPVPSHQNHDGSLNFRVQYYSDKNLLCVTIMEGLDLPAMDSDGKSDPYIEVTLLPDRKQKFSTGVKTDSLNPTFNETFDFEVSSEELTLDKVLELKVMDKNKTSSDVLMGIISIPLRLSDLTSRGGKTYCCSILHPLKDLNRSKSVKESMSMARLNLKISDQSSIICELEENMVRLF